MRMRVGILWVVVSLIFLGKAQEDGFDANILGGGENINMEEMMAQFQNRPERRFTRDIPFLENEVQYVQCDTCKELLKQLRKMIDERVERLKKTKLREVEVQEMLEGICNPMEEKGEWIAHLDAVFKDGSLSLERQESLGHCEEECKTIAKACQNIVDEADSDLSEAVYLNKPGLENKVCSQLIQPLKGACGQKLQPLENREPSFGEFRPKSDIDIALADAGKDLRKLQEENPNYLDDL